MNLSPQDFPQLSFPFLASHLRSARAIWLNEKYPEHFYGCAEANKEIFVKRFAYLVPGGITFDKLALDEHDTIIFSGERYGGAGIGNNGGGARCGNIAGLQVKGVGRNILAGDADIHHSYGGFKAVYAIHEAIYSHILSELLPAGVAEVHGVMLTGPDAAYIKGTERGWGGLMVRESALRPANFLRAGLFSPPPNVARSILSDVGRVRAVNRQLSRIAQGNKVIELFGTFLANAADQFSFARLAGLMHGAVTPSNLCLDGRWIDLTNTSFLCTSKNWAGGNRKTASFHEEMLEPARILLAMIETFGKFNGRILNPNPLVHYYRECLDDGLIIHSDYVFGLPRGSFSSQNRAELQSLLNAVLATSEPAPVVYDRWPTDAPEREPTFERVAQLFVAASSEDVAAINGDAISMALAASFRKIMLGCKPAHFAPNSDPHFFLVATAIAAARRLLLKAFFFKGRLEARLNHLLAADEIDQLEWYIGATLDASKWIFDLTLTCRATVVKLPDLSINFDAVAGWFEINVAGHAATQVFDSNELKEWCGSNRSKLLLMGEFDLFPYILRLLKLIQMMNIGACRAV